MSEEKRQVQRCSRYGAAVVTLGGAGVVFLVGALRHVALQHLLVVLLWTAVGCAALGWAVGHAAGRLWAEAAAQQERERCPEPARQTRSSEEARIAEAETAPQEEEKGHPAEQQSR